MTQSYAEVGVVATLRAKSHIPFSCVMLATQAWHQMLHENQHRLKAQSPDSNLSSTRVFLGEGAQMLRSGPGQALMKMLRLGSYCISVSVISSASMLCCCPGCYGCASMRPAPLQEIMKRSGCLSALLLKYARGSPQPGRPVFFNKSMAVVASCSAPLHAFSL